MTYRWLTDLADVLRAAGIPVTEVDGWAQRGRPSSTGDFDPSGVLCHHTASPEGTSDQSELNVILAGNSEAPGPISQLGLFREFHGVYVIAAGRANHAGSGLAPWLGQQKTDGNAAMIGIEVGNDGSGEPWPDWQTELYARTVGALLAHYGWPLDHVLIHHDFSQPYYPSSKCDPAGPWCRQPDLAGGFAGTWDVDVWRAFITDTMGGAPPRPPKDDTMALYILAPDGANARFLGVGAGGFVPFVEWVDEARYAAYQLHAEELPVPMDALTNITCIGPLPPDGLDTLHDWRASDFYRVAE